jgi:hypothetical protein
MMPLRRALLRSVDFARPPLQDDLPLPEEIDVVGQSKGVIDLLFYEQNGRLGRLSDLVYRFEDILFEQR